jgi:phospholipid-binding lipoprotein MlaA
MLPILGMGTVRDWAGWTVDFQVDPLWQNDSGAAWGLILWRYTSDRAALLSSEAALEGSFDEYALIRRAYLQRRRYQVFDGSPPEEPSFEPSDDPADPAADPSPEPSADPLRDTSPAHED